MRRPSGTSAMPERATVSGARPRMESPRSFTSPACTGQRPMIAWSVVDLPAPFGPIRPTISPSSISRDSPRTADGRPDVRTRTLDDARRAARHQPRHDVLHHRRHRRGRQPLRPGCGGPPPACPPRGSCPGRAPGSGRRPPSRAPCCGRSAERPPRGRRAPNGRRRRTPAPRPPGGPRRARPAGGSAARWRAPGRPRACARRRGRGCRRAAPRSGRARRARAAWSRGGAPRAALRREPSAATSTFSRTLSDANDRECWNVRARPARPRRCGLHRVTSRPDSSTVPAVGKSKPVSTFTSVVLPAPFGPISPTTSWRCSSSVTSRRAWTPWKWRETPVARRVSPGHRPFGSEVEPKP